jgi:spermidine synthase
MFCHGELVRLRPDARQLTLFYLLIALGGALGGTFVGIVAPTLFPDVWEFHIAVLIGWVVIWFAWSIDRTSPFHTGDRWLFAALLTVALGVAFRYLVERTGVGRIDWVSAHAWTATFGVTITLAAGASAVFWKSKVARLSLWPYALVALLILLSGALLIQRVTFSREPTLYASRNFYGVVRVESVVRATGELRRLWHGTTTHGYQLQIPALRNIPTAYYSRSSGIALAARLIRDGRLGEKPRGAHFGIVGLGVGTMSAFGQPGDRIRYYEINPQVVKIVQEEEPYFTFVRDSPSDVSVIVGDGRLSLERELSEGNPQHFDLLSMDAFSSDSVPLHLLTVEAFRLYAQHLRTDRSILAVNVTNRHLDLEPVVAANARALGFAGIRVDNPGDPPVVIASSWILLARDAGIFEPSALSISRARPLGDRIVSFTDNYSNLFRVLQPLSAQWAP